MTLKKSKYARINEESENEKKEIKQAIQSSIPPRLRDQPRKESNFIVLDGKFSLLILKNNEFTLLNNLATMDEETAKKIILDAVNLLGNSPGSFFFFFFFFFFFLLLLLFQFQRKKISNIFYYYYLGLGRFILFLQQEDSNQSDTLIVHVISELEKNFKFGDEVLGNFLLYFQIIFLSFLFFFSLNL